MIYHEKGIDLLTTDVESLDEQTAIAKAITLYREATEPGYKPPFDPRLTYKCRVWIARVRFTKSEAEDAVSKAADRVVERFASCRRVYGIDTGCVFEDYACVATQSFQCECDWTGYPKY